MFKIYKIIDNTNDNVYIGITKQKYLCDRISHHNWCSKHKEEYSSSLIIKNNDWKYELIEETDDITREKYWINNTPNCINKYKLNGLNIKIKKENDKKYNDYRLKKFHWKKSWGGDPRNSNNLLNIDINLFIQNHN